jgi:hypothetical protein
MNNTSVASSVPSSVAPSVPFVVPDWQTSEMIQFPGHTPMSRYGRVRMPSFKLRALICAYYDEESNLAMEKHIIDICEFYHHSYNYHTMIDKYFDAGGVEGETALPEGQWSLTGRQRDNFSFRWN